MNVINKQISTRKRYLLNRYQQLQSRLQSLLQRGFSSVTEQFRLNHLLLRLNRYARRLALPALSMAALIGVQPMVSYGQITGDEFMVNQATSGDQSLPDIASDTKGNTVVVYESPDGDFSGIFMRRYDANGSPISDEVLVNTTTSNIEDNPAVAMDTNGDFVVVWDGADIYGQRYQANGTPIGTEFKINTYTTGFQSKPAIAMDSDGNFTVVWESDEQDGDREGIYGQRYNANGEAQGREFQINTITTSIQDDPAIAMDSDGDFTVVWKTLVNPSGGAIYDIHAQRFQANGTPQGAEFLVNTYTTSLQSFPDIAMDTDGDFTVVWESQGQDNSNYGIYGQRYSANGNLIGTEFQVNTYTTSSQASPTIAMNSVGNFVVVWESFGQDDAGTGIYGQRYQADGVKSGIEFNINTYTSSSQDFPAVAMDTEGNFSVAWESSGQDDSGDGIYGQRFFIKDGIEFPINTYTTSSQDNASVAMDAIGNFVVVWESSGQDGSSNGIYGQRYAANGALLGIEFKVNTYTTSNQDSPQIGMDLAGNFVVVWESFGQDDSSDGIYGQRYASNGNPIGTEFQINSYTSSSQDDPSVAMDSDGNFVVVWESSGQDNSNDGIYGQRYATNGNPIGTEFQINSYTSNAQKNPSTAMDINGNFVVVWESSGQDDSSEGIYGQKYNKEGNAIGEEFRINTYTSSYQIAPAIAMDSDGDFNVVWLSFGQDGAYGGIYGQRYQANGTPKEAEFKINNYTTSGQYAPSIAMNMDGDFTVVWESEQDGSQLGVYGQRYLANGNTLGTEFRVNTNTKLIQETASVAMNLAGDFIVAWEDSSQDGSSRGVYGQRYQGKFPVSCNITPLTLSGSETSAIVHQTANTIQSTQNILTGAAVNYKSGTSITLKAGFQVATGATFSALIEACNTAFVPENEALTERSKESTIPTILPTTNELTVYPNPTQDILYYKVSEKEQVLQVILFNSLGQAVQQGQLTNKELGIGNLEKGMYWLVVQTDKRNYSKAVVKN